ncbi:hypothetical protein [Devosia sp. 2618]|uniref:hypothetical protein n=1 Tax=Devosia sp. 2618 TaxID=3156454 RepID=UPI0033993B1F
MKTVLVRSAKIVVAMFAGFIIIAIAPFGIASFWPFVVTGCGLATFLATRERATTPIVAQAQSLPTSTNIQKGKRRLWGSALAFIIAVGGFVLWSYLDAESQKSEALKRSVASQTQKMLGPNFHVQSVSLPDGIGSYETTAVVVFTTVADEKRDSLTMVLTGDCGDTCRIRMDPRDALRLAPLR